MFDKEKIESFTNFARQAKDGYYPVLDAPERRGELLQRYVPGDGQQPIMNWNGHVCYTSDDIQNYLRLLPRTKHEVDSADAHPLMLHEGQITFVLTTSGTVEYDEQHRRTFYQRLVFSQVEGRLRILNDYYRWTGEGKQRPG